MYRIRYLFQDISITTVYFSQLNTKNEIERELDFWKTHMPIPREPLIIFWYLENREHPLVIMFAKRSFVWVMKSKMVRQVRLLTWVPIFDLFNTSTTSSWLAVKLRLHNTYRLIARLIASIFYDCVCLCNGYILFRVTGCFDIVKNDGFSFVWRYFQEFIHRNKQLVSTGSLLKR